jgi:CPA2 family monovalent cation:H+ antiporter-2
MAFVAGKALVIILVGAGLRWPPEVAARIAVILAHGGEFGLLLLTLALQVGALAGDIAQPALFALALTMGLGPILIQNNGRIARLVETASHRRQIAGAEAAIESESRALRDHVLLCGCGRVGRLVALVLDAADLPYVAVERDLARFRAAKRQGHKVFFGDVTRKSVMEAAGLGRARAVVVTFDHRHAVERILHRVRHDNPAASTIVSAQDDRELPALVAAGAGIVFPENFAAGLALADQVLLVSGLSQDEAARVVTEVRAELSPELTGRVGL